MFHKRLIINGEEYLLAVNLAGHGAPTDGTPGMFYTDLDTGDVYKCIAENTWEKFVVALPKAEEASF